MSDISMRPKSSAFVIFNTSFTTKYYFRKLSNITTEEILVGGVEEITVSYLPGSMPDIAWPFIISGIEYNSTSNPYA